VSHTWLLQSEACVQRSPGAQDLHLPPPQSRSVSDVSCTPFEQDASWHTPMLQKPSKQSAFTAQALLGPQGAHSAPQSASVSPGSSVWLSQCPGLAPGPPWKPKDGTAQDAANRVRATSNWRVTAPLAARSLTSRRKKQRQPIDVPAPSRFRSSVSNGCRKQLYAARKRDSTYISIKELS
jgi:hypothetical protein